MKLYFLGPRGTYSEIASNKVKSLINCEMIPVSTIAKVIELVNSEVDSVGVLPIENKIDGIVRPTIDNIFSHNLKIQAEFNLDIIHCLVSKSKDISNIKHIISHPQALAQSQKYITQNFDENIDLICANSTAHAGELLKNNDETYSALVSYKLAQELGYNIIKTDTADIKENKTRFVVLSKNNLNLSKKTRTTFVFNTKNESGALLKILNIIHKYNLNLIYLESRPSKKVFGEYNFFCDIDKGDDEIQEALREIENECNSYRFLGSYGEI